jgi:hypothetical protein
VPHRPVHGAAARASAATILAPLGFLHPDGTPITQADCAAQYRKVCSDNSSRSRRLKELEQSEAPDRFEHAELCRAALMGNLMARAWGALEGLVRLAQEEGEL